MVDSEKQTRWLLLPFLCCHFLRRSWVTSSLSRKITHPLLISPTEVLIGQQLLLPIETQNETGSSESCSRSEEMSSKIALFLLLALIFPTALTVPAFGQMCHVAHVTCLDQGSTFLKNDLLLLFIQYFFILRVKHVLKRIVLVSLTIWTKPSCNDINTCICTSSIFCAHTVKTNLVTRQLFSIFLTATAGVNPRNTLHFSRRTDERKR